MSPSITYIQSDSQSWLWHVESMTMKKYRKLKWHLYSGPFTLPGPKANSGTSSRCWSFKTMGETKGTWSDTVLPVFNQACGAFAKGVQIWIPGRPCFSLTHFFYTLVTILGFFQVTSFRSHKFGSIFCIPPIPPPFVAAEEKRKLVFQSASPNSWCHLTADRVGRDQDYQSLNLRGPLFPMTIDLASHPPSF